MEETNIICQSCGESNPEDSAECVLCGNSFRWVIRERRHLKVCAAWRSQVDKANAALVIVHNENVVFKQALQRIASYPVHSEPVGGAGAMQDIAYNALATKEAR